MRNKYSLTAQLLGKRTYSNAVNRMYESLVEPRNNKPPEWLAKRQKMLDDIADQYYNIGAASLSDEEREEVEQVDPLNADINKDYEEAKEIHAFLDAIQPGAVSNPDVVKTKIERYVKLSKDIRRKLKKLADISAAAAPGKGFESYFDRGNLGIEPIQDFVDTRRGPSTTVGGQNIPGTAARERFDQEITIGGGKPRKLQDYIIDTIEAAGVPQDATRYGRKAKQRPPTMRGPRGGLPEDNVSSFADPKLGTSGNVDFPFKIWVKDPADNKNHIEKEYNAQILGTSYGDIATGANSKLASATEALTRVDFVLDDEADLSYISNTDFSEAMAALAVNGSATNNKNLSPGRSDALTGGSNSHGNFVQGGSVSFDVVGADGRKWECKQLKTLASSQTIGVTDSEYSTEAARLGRGAQEMSDDAVFTFMGLIGPTPGRRASRKEEGGLLNLTGKITTPGNNMLRVLRSGLGGNTSGRGTVQSYINSPRAYTSGLWHAGRGEAKTLSQTVNEKEATGVFGKTSRVPYLLSDIIEQTALYLDGLQPVVKDALRAYVIKVPERMMDFTAGRKKIVHPDGSETPGQDMEGRSLMGRPVGSQVQDFKSYFDPSVTLGTGGLTDDKLEEALSVIAVSQRTVLLYELVFEPFMADDTLSTIQKIEKSVKNFISELFPGIDQQTTLEPTDPSGYFYEEQIVQSPDQAIALAKEYLDDVPLAGFIFTIVQKNMKRFSIFVVPRKAALYMASIGALEFEGPSSGRFKVKFTPPESGDKKYLTEPLSHAVNESFSVFDGGSVGKTLNEWIEWATK